MWIASGSIHVHILVCLQQTIPSDAYHWSHLETLLYCVLCQALVPSLCPQRKDDHSCSALYSSTVCREEDAQ